MAMVDQLAESLTRKTGCEWVIQRGRVAGRMRYGLRVGTRDSESGFIDHGFGGPYAHNHGYSLAELTRWLASISDMIDMGFVKNLHNEEE